MILKGDLKYCWLIMCVFVDLLIKEKGWRRFSFIKNVKTKQELVRDSENKCFTVISIDVNDN